MSPAEKETGKDGLPLITPKSRADFHRWLTRNGAKADGVWVRHAKKGTGIPSLERDANAEITEGNRIESPSQGVVHGCLRFVRAIGE